MSAVRDVSWLEIVVGIVGIGALLARPEPMAPTPDLATPPHPTCVQLVNATWWHQDFYKLLDEPLLCGPHVCATLGGREVPVPRHVAADDGIREGGCFGFRGGDRRPDEVPELVRDRPAGAAGDAARIHHVTRGRYVVHWHTGSGDRSAFFDDDGRRIGAWSDDAIAVARVWDPASSYQHLVDYVVVVTEGGVLRIEHDGAVRELRISEMPLGSGAVKLLPLNHERVVVHLPWQGDVVVVDVAHGAVVTDVAVPSTCGYGLQ